MCNTIKLISNTNCQKAQEAYREGKYDDALELVSKCLSSIIRDSLGKSMGLKPQQFYDTKFLEADIYMIRKEFEKADEVFESLKPTLVGDSEMVSYLRAKNYYLKARIEDARNNPLEFGDNMQNAKQHFINANLYQEAIDILFDLMDFNKERISSGKIMELYEEIEELSKKVRDKDDSRLNSAKAKLELVKIGVEDKEARSLLNDAISDFEKIKNYPLAGEAKIELANIEEKYDLDKSEKLIEEALQYLPPDNLDLNTSLKLASLKIMKGESKDLLESLNSNIDKLPSATRNTSLSRTMLNLSKSTLIHLHTSHKELVERTIKECITLNEELDQRYGKGISFLLEGLFLSLTGDTDGGKNKLNMLKILYKKLEKDIAGLTSRNWQTETISFIAQYEETKEIGNFIKDRGSEVLDAEILFLGGMYLEKMDYQDDAKKVLSKSKDLFKKHSSRKNSLDGIVELLKTY